MPPFTSPRQFPVVTYGAYQCWMAARDQLSQTVESYVNACSALVSTFSHSGPLLAAHQDILHQVASMFDTHIPALADEELALRDAHMALLRSRNSAKLVSPINGLPSELLTNILSMASQASAPTHDLPRKDQVSPTDLASVCHSWRQLLLTSPSFWSHLDFIVDIPYISEVQLHQLQLWSERSRSASVSLGINIRVHPDQRRRYLGLDNEHELPTITVISTLAKVLAPIASRVHYVKIELLELVSASFFQALLGCVAVTCKAKPIDRLTLRFRPDDFYDSDEPLEVFPWNEDATRHPGYCTDSEIERFLGSIGVLDLDSISFPNYRVAPTKLRELSLSTTSAKLSEILEILRFNPRLQSLSLVHVFISKDIEVEPVYLPRLRSLKLLWHGCYDLRPVLLLLVPGDTPLDVHMDIDKTCDETSDPIVSFFRRSNISTLHAVGHYRKLAWFTRLSSGLPRLKQLTLQGCNFDGPDLVSYLDAHVGTSLDANSTIGGSARDVPWPQLQALSLVDCGVVMNHLKRLVGLHSIQSFRFVDHRKPSSCFECPSLTLYELKQLEQEMSDIIPDVKFSGF